jgi:aryl-alcohol dehydrogenase-like predicted oxidoreductase
MGLDYVDIYMMHRDNLDVPVGEFIDAMNRCVKAGTIKALGVSNWTLARVDEANAYARRNGLAEIVALSNQFSLAEMIEPPWGGCFSSSGPADRAWLAKSGVTLMPWSSQARGFFTDRAAPDKRDDAELVRCWYSEANFQRRGRAVELAAKRGVSLIAMALAYVLQQPFPTFPLIGPRTLAEFRQSLTALAVKLSPRELKWLNLEA